MPCSSDWGHTEYMAQADALMNMLCGLCSLVEDKNGGWMLDKVPNLREWREDHKAGDKQRGLRG